MTYEEAKSLGMKIRRKCWKSYQHVDVEKTLDRAKELHDKMALRRAFNIQFDESRDNIHDVAIFDYSNPHEEILEEFLIKEDHEANDWEIIE
jgi:hypothetical protein